jgi:hypothetical protein
VDAQLAGVERSASDSFRLVMIELDWEDGRPAGIRPSVV